MQAVREIRNAGGLGPAALANLEAWSTGDGYASQWEAIGALLAARNTEEIEDAFGSVIPFGTGGRRGAMGRSSRRAAARSKARSSTYSTI